MPNTKGNIDFNSHMKIGQYAVQYILMQRGIQFEDVNYILDNFNDKFTLKVTVGNMPACVQMTKKSIDSKLKVFIK